MPEFRKDPVLGDWVLFPARERRSEGEGACPLCAVKEEIGDARVGVVRTESPLLDRRSIVDRTRHAHDLYTSMTGAGEHETIIESKEHGARMADFEPAHVAEILALYRARLLYLRQDNRFRHMAIVKTEGRRAGAVCDHPATEIFALPFVPEAVKTKMHGIQGHHRRTGTCIYCDTVKHERHEKSRKVAETLHHVALAPFASRSPFEVMLLPKGHHVDFAEASDADLADLAGLLSDVLVRLDLAVGDPAFIMTVETAPREIGGDHGQFHWHVEIHPRLAERARDLFGVAAVNPILPEEAARLLREASP